MTDFAKSYSSKQINQSGRLEDYIPLLQRRDSQGR